MIKEPNITCLSVHVEVFIMRCLRINTGSTIHVLWKLEAGLFRSKYCHPGCPASPEMR